MKIEVFIYGMFEGRIRLLKTDGVDQILTQQNFYRLRNLRPEDSEKYLWLPTEQVIAYPSIRLASDDNGREWIENKTLLITIHDYLRWTNANQLLKPYSNVPSKLPDYLSPINLEKQVCMG